MTAAIIILGIVVLALVGAFVVAIDIISKRHAAELDATVARSGENMNLLFAKLAESQAREAALAQKIMDAQAATIERQQETIEKTHARLVLPMEQAVTDIRNSDEKLTPPTQGFPVPQEEWATPTPVLSTSPADLPYDLTEPEDL